MSGTAPPMVGLGVGGGELGCGGYRAPFTAVQWQELEQQAMVYKYLVAGLPVPPDLVMPIRHSLEELSARFSHHPAFGYYSYYGKKFDPEPGRCRRTDGKKWRCSKEAHPESKYCERHMNRGRNRSRKPVESQSTSQSLSTAISHISTGCSSNSGSSQHMPFYSAVSSEGSSLGSNTTKLQMGPISCGIGNREFSFSQEASGRVGSLGLGSSAGSGMWSLMPSQVSSSPLLKQESDFQLQGNSSAQQYMPRASESINARLPKQKQYSVFRSDIGSPAPVKQEQHPVHLFFSEWPASKQSWSNLDDDGSNQNVFSSTQLSISVPGPSSSFPSGVPYSTNDA